MKNIFASVQWTLFILAGSIIVPITVASLYSLSPEMTVGFVQRTLFVLGLAGILQVSFGHKLPIQEGPAGLWWGVLILYAGIGSVLFGSHIETLKAMQFAFLLSGVIFITASLLGFVEKIAKLISPTVVGVYLILLVAQVSGSFLNGMSGITGETSAIQPKVLILSIIIILMSFTITKIPKIEQYSLLITILIGWGLFLVFNLANPIIKVSGVFNFPEIFVFGIPEIETNLILMVILITFLLLANMLAAIKAIQLVFDANDEKYEEQEDLKATGIMAGLNQLFAGIFSAIGPVPLSSSAGFIATTKLTNRLPFIIGSFFIIIISLLPKITAFFASIPEAVGYAAIFPVYAIMIEIAMKTFDSSENKPRMYKIVGLSLFAGIGVMFIPPEAFKNLSPVVTSILSNGLVFGSMIAISLDYTMSKND